jgi:hypothetical protein
VFGRARRASDTGSYSALFLLRNSSSAYYCYLGTDADGDSLKAFNGSGNGTTTVVTLANDIWFDWAYVANGIGGHTVYYKPQHATSWTSQSGGGVQEFTPDQFYVGNNDTLSQPFNGRITDVRVWSAALTGTELLTEAASATAVRTSNLWADYRVDTEENLLVDSSGNGRTATSSGTLTFEAEPSIGGAADALLNATAVGLSSYSSNWTDPNQRFDLVASNGGIQATDQVVDFAWYNAISFLPDQWAEIELANPSGGTDYIGPAVRCSSGGNAYWFYASIGAGAWYWGKLVGGSYTVVDSVTGGLSGWATGDILRIEVRGTTVKLKRNGVQIGSDYTGRTELSSGSPGIAGYHNAAGTGTNGRYWQAGDFSGFVAWDFKPDVQQIFHNPR